MKRTISLVVALTMLAMVLACASADDLQMSDIPGMTAPGVLPIVTEPTELTIGLAQSVSVTDYDDNYLTKTLEEDTGLDLVFELYPSAETGTVIDLKFSSGEPLPDVMLYEFMGNTASYGAQGYLIPLENYFEKYSYFLYHSNSMTEDDIEQFLVRCTEADSHVYSYGCYVMEAEDLVRTNLFINQLWLNKLGLEMPTTKEELYNVLVAFRDNDMDGDGDPTNEIPMIGSSTWNGMISEALINLFIYYNRDCHLNVEDDVVYAPFATKEWQDAMIFMNKLCAEGLLSPLSFTMTEDEFVSIIESKDAEHQIIGVFDGCTTTVCPNFDKSECLLAYDLLPPLEGTFTPIRPANVTRFGHITCDCDIPEIAFRFFDYFADERISLITRYGEPGVNFYYRPDDPELFDSIYPCAVQVAQSMGLKPIHAQIIGAESPWSGPNNKIWNLHPMCMLPSALYDAKGSTVPADEMSFSWEDSWASKNGSAHRTYLNASVTAYSGNTPAQLFTSPVYTVEESDAYGDTISTIQTYVKEMIASFATGALDPVTDWDEYIANLEAAGLQDWLNIAQAYWTRSH